MDDRFVQSTSKDSKAKVQPTARKKFHASTPYERQPSKSKTICEYENITSENNTAYTEALSLLKIIIKKQESLEKRIGQIENSVFNTESVILKDIIQRSQAMAKNKNIQEQKVILNKSKNIPCSGYKKAHSDCHTFGEIEDVTFEEIASKFPLVTMDAILEVEEKLNIKQYNKSMVAFIHKLKDICNSVDGVLRRIFTDTLMQNFNWDGRWGKTPLNTLKIINQIVFETFQCDTKTFELNVKKYVELSRNRVKQKARLHTKNRKQQEFYLGYP